MLAVRLAVRINPGNIIQHLSYRKSSNKYTNFLTCLLCVRKKKSIIKSKYKQLLTDLIDFLNLS